MLFSYILVVVNNVEIDLTAEEEAQRATDAENFEKEKQNEKKMKTISLTVINGLLQVLMELTLL